MSDKPKIIAPFPFGRNADDPVCDANAVDIKVGNETKDLQTAFDELTKHIKQYSSISQFPLIGSEGYLYIDATAKKTYAWSEEKNKEGYYCIGSDYSEINVIQSSI